MPCYKGIGIGLRKAGEMPAMFAMGGFLLRTRFAVFVLGVALFSGATWMCVPAAAAAQQQTEAQLEKLSGEYTNAPEPDTPLSFYVQNGKLVAESERMVPTELKEVSATEFAIPDSKATFRFKVDADGKGVSVVNSNDPIEAFKRTGDAVHHVFHDYVRTEAMIPMRDGVKLHVVILKPSDIQTPLPFLIQRTPYGADGTSRGSFFGSRPELARAGYIYVGADIRGRYKSEGEFVMSRPMVDHGADHKDPKAVDESTDSYDTVEWLLKNVAGNNGRAGFVGTSYPGFLAMAAGIDPHPAVKCVSPQAPMIDVWMGDDFFHNGAFRQTYGYDYVMGMETSKEGTDVSYGKGVDGYDYFLGRGSFEQDVKQSGSKVLPTWQLFLDHPAYDSNWSSRGVQHHLNRVQVPVLSVGGYYDQEDMWGPQAEYSSLEPHDDKHENFLVLGPWRHGYWGSSSRHLGNLQYGEPIGKEFRRDIEAKFFAHYLKDEAGWDLEDTASFQTGSNKWMRYGHFPPQGSQPTALHLGGDRKLSWGDVKAAATTTYVSDPANPVPYRHQADSADLWRWVAVVQLAHRGSAVCGRSQGRGDVEDSGEEGPGGDGRGDRGYLCIDHGDGWGLHRQADRSVSRGRCRPEDARLSTNDERGDLPRALSGWLQPAACDQGGRCAGVQVEPARRGSPVQGGAHHCGRGAEHVVPAL